MSMNESESGIYSLTAIEFKRFIKEFSEQWNALWGNYFSTASRVYPLLKKENDIEDAFTDLLYPKIKGYGDYWIVRNQFLGIGKSNQVYKPKLSDLKEIQFNHRYKKEGLTSFPVGDGTLSFSVESKSVRWKVERNNHAVRDSRSHPLAKWFFGKFLPSVNWHGQTGGSVLYVNEFMEDGGPCSPEQVDMYGTVKKEHDKRMSSMLRKSRRRAA